MESSSVMLDALVQQTRRLATAYPDVIYKSDDDYCHYHRGAAGPGCGCIIGQAIRALPPTVEREQLWRLATSRPANPPNFSALAVLYGWSPQDNRISWLRRVQSEQDAGIPWGACVMEADTCITSPS